MDPSTVNQPFNHPYRNLLSSNRNHLLEDFVILPIFATEKENNN